MEGPKYQVIAFISGILTLVAFSSLVLRVHLTKKTEHLTYTWIMLVLLAQSLLVVYGIINKTIGIYLPAVILISGILYIFYTKYNYEENIKIEKELIQKNILSN
jgi:uncharacterized protein with PQ loop repeat